MYTALRRGPSSIQNLSRTASAIFAPVNKPSIIPLSLRSIIRPVSAPRCLNTAFSSRRYNGLAHARRPQHDERLELSATANDGPVYTKFQELADEGLVHPNIIMEITKGMGHETMTPVQTLTVNEALKGRDTIAQARTGTGKTLGFLIPAVQKILADNPELANRPRGYSGRDRAKASDIRGIIMSPTRELAEQIAAEARKITRNTGVIVQVAVGGNSKSGMLRQMQREGCHLLVATPGRLNDLLSDPYSRVAAPDLNTFVLDEADRLLDAGFADEIENIISQLPDRQVKDRQTMLFSATVPREVMGLVRNTLKNDFQFVQTIQEGELPTHERIPQKLVEVGGFENLMPALLELCKREIASRTQPTSDSPPFKAIIYFSSTANVELANRIFEGLKSPQGGLFAKHPLWPAEISEMHGRLTQAQRTRVSERFRRAKSGIMFSTDVTARGMDFPNVTHVIQVGLPPNQDQYVHRVGRTGRGDKSGEGWILLTSLEMKEARYRLRGLPLVPDATLETAKVDMTRDAQLAASQAETLSQIGDATKMVDRGLKGAAYLAMIGTMQGVSDKQLMIDTLNRWTRYGWGWETPPPVPRGLAAKLGLSRVRGLEYGERFPSRDGEDFMGGGRGRPSSGPDRGYGGRGPSSFGSDRGRGGQRGFGYGGDRERGGRPSYGRDRGGDRGRGDRGDREDRFIRS